MFPFRTVELAFRRFQTRREPRALAVVFDRTAPELLALARHLAPPGTEAEDLLQATFVTAIEAADTHRKGERVLPWLCGILANHARAARRAGRRAVDAARLPHAVTDAGLDAEASELRAELRAAIDRLPEVYRPVLRLVFEHGLPAQEVAHALERPAGTVRAQVTRGLELLRRTLPASLAGGVAVAVAGRGLAAVRQSVLTQAGGTGVGAGSPLLLGGLLVLHHKFVAAGAAALFAALGLFWFLHEPPTPVAPDPGTRAAPAAAASAPLEAPGLEPDRRTVAEARLPPADPSPAEPTAAPTATVGGEVVVRVRTPRHEPAVSVRVALCPFAELQDFGRRMDYLATDEHGTVHFAALPNGDWAIDVDRIGTVGVITSRAGRTVEREVTLPTGLRVEGHVVDRRGAPVPGATLVLHGSRASATPVGTADAQGAFAIEHLVPGIELQARAPQREPSPARAVRGATGSTVAMQLELGDQARTVRGYVVGPDGRGVHDAVVAILPAGARTVQVVDPAEPQVRATWLHTAADGSFVSDEIGLGAQIVFARKLPFAPAWVELDRSNATAELRLRAGATLAGSVTRGDAPVAGANVLAWATAAAPIGYLQNLFGMRHAVTGADGSYRIDGIVPGQHTVSLMQQTTTLRRATLTLDEGTTYPWSADLAAAQSLKIVLRGERLPTDARVVAMVRSQPLRDGEAPSIVPIQADGTGELPLARDGTVEVILTTLPGGMSMVQFALVRDVPTDQQEVVFELRADQLPQRSITGRLVDARRAPVADATVTASRVDATGLVVRLDATTGSDGTFCLGPLPSADYRLYAGPARAPVAIGAATLTTERDEPVGDLVVER